MERKELLLAVLIGVLLVSTAVQTIAMVGMSSAPAGSVVTSTPAPGTGSAGAAAGGSLENIPDMVGGC